MTRNRVWRKSSRSGALNECVEVALSADSTAVRDSKLGAASPVLAFGPASFDTFVRRLKSGRLDR
ncbi:MULTISPECIES: DUF397 domain-containing protein [unclassified Saccharopolyspora]|uniref:DUF397 domain-containing protein n=1 Tax=unclassified Saccharopolyspora TaxID=2646250 RepID=UPI001CD41015|nr:MULTISPECIES: DUF397 domain-containing protein [unclassified Saccharopolyspora]MCA1228686.1 DUF397 domain-containing protein [Saccharopolyspora sp. 6M]MCA1282656.1 DUF397 domain-containing protein [Saccharopolyspora sp. 7B]